MTDPIIPSDEELESLATSGDAAAFGELASRCRDGLVRCLALLTGDLDEAESLAQEALTRALTTLSSRRPETSFAAWVRGIALNLSREFQRRRSRHARPTTCSVLGSLTANHGHASKVLSDLIRKEVEVNVRLAVARLPNSYREVVVLHYVEGLDYNQIAEITGVEPAALRARALRARALLRIDLGSVVDSWLVADID